MNFFFGRNYSSLISVNLIFNSSSQCDDPFPFKGTGIAKEKKKKKERILILINQSEDEEKKENSFTFFFSIQNVTSTKRRLATISK